ncbi:MAG: hypothetical protein IKX59_08915 [Bacteroidales bacterium]|nr:hypothetical protein [Bacteroidales bacterium]
MDESKRQYIITEVAEALRRGDNSEDVFETYLYRCMFLYRNPNPVICSYRPAPKDVYEALSNNDVICKEDICLEQTIVADNIYYELEVKIHPQLSLTVLNYDGLKVTLNGKSKVKNWVGHLAAEELANWMVRMKQNLQRHIEEWNTLPVTIIKTHKRQKIALSAIRAIFTNAMKDYPKVKYSIKEQKSRARIDVMISEYTCKTIYAYWSTYREKLPSRIEEVKALLDKSRKPI